jgi:8-oxo-dGTP pyrophosphatase MutT (NUDIX family)
MKESATVLTFNRGLILGVSRKDNINDWGIAGGKLEPGENHEQCAIRETLEETGLHIFGLQKIFERQDGEWHNITFLAQWTGEISTNESGRVAWVTFDKLKEGSFKEYNTALETHLKEIGFFNGKEPEYFCKHIV